MSASWVFGVDVFDLDLWVHKLIRSNSQSNATLWVLDTCLIVGLRFDNHFDGSFFVFKKCTTGTHLEKNAW